MAGLLTLSLHGLLELVLRLLLKGLHLRVQLLPLVAEGICLALHEHLQRSVLLSILGVQCLQKDVRSDHARHRSLLSVDVGHRLFRWDGLLGRSRLVYGLLGRNNLEGWIGLGGTRRSIRGAWWDGILRLAATARGVGSRVAGHVLHKIEA